MKPQPISLYSEAAIDRAGQHVVTFLSYPKYHRHENGTLHETDCAILESQVPGWDWEVSEGTWSIYIRRDGAYQSQFHGHTILRKPLGLGFYNSVTKEHVVVVEFDLLSWPTLVGGNNVMWADPETHITYKVEYVQDAARAIVEVPQSVQDELLSKLPDWASEDAYVGIVYDASIDFLNNCGVVTEDRVVFGNSDWLIKVGGTLVTHEKFDDTDKEKRQGLSWTKHIIYLPQQAKYIEACVIGALRSEEGKLIFNDTDIFQEGVDGYTGCEDTYMNVSGTPGPHGSEVYFYLSDAPWGTTPIRGLIKFDLSGEIPVAPVPYMINSASLSLYCTSYTGGSNGDTMRFQVHGALKPWTESQAVWNRWDQVNDKWWHTFGCDEGNDYAYFNDFSGYGYDRTNSYEHAFVNDADVDGWVDIDLEDILWQLQKQYDDQRWYGWVLIADQPVNYETTAAFASSEYVDTSKRPKLTVTFVPSSTSSSSSSSCSSSFSSSFSSSSSSWGPYLCRFGEYTVLEHLHFATENPDGVQIDNNSIVYNCYTHQASGADYPAWNAIAGHSSFISSEGVSAGGYAFHVTGYQAFQVTVAGSLAHDSRVGIYAARFSEVISNLVYNCDSGIQVVSDYHGADVLVYQNTIYNCTNGIYCISQAAGTYILGNIIDSCDYGIYSGAGRSSYLNWNNFNNNSIADIYNAYMDKGPDTTSFDPGFFDVGILDFRIGQHMRGLGPKYHFGSNNLIDSACISYPDQGAVQRREVVGVDAAVRTTGPDAHQGTGYVLLSPTHASRYAIQWEFLTPVKAGRRTQFSFWCKGLFGGLFRFTTSGPGANLSESVTVTGSYQQHLSASVMPTQDAFVKVKLYARGTGNVYVDDFAVSQSSSSSSSSQSSSSSSSS